MSVFSQSPIQVTPDTPVNSTWWNNQVYTKLIEIDNFLSNPNNFVPSGIIAMWSGSVASIPTGWGFCDGNGGRPDLRDRFIVGAGSSYAVKATGGEATHTLTVSEMPSHSHSIDAWLGGAGGPNRVVYGNYITHNAILSTGSTGGGVAHENRPPYMALCYIQKL